MRGGRARGHGSARAPPLHGYGRGVVEDVGTERVPLVSEREQGEATMTQNGVIDALTTCLEEVSGLLNAYLRVVVTELNISFSFAWRQTRMMGKLMYWLFISRIFD